MQKRPWKSTTLKLLKTLQKSNNFAPHFRDLDWIRNVAGISVVFFSVLRWKNTLSFLRKLPRSDHNGVSVTSHRWVRYLDLLGSNVGRQVIRRFCLYLHANGKIEHQLRYDHPLNILDLHFTIVVPSNSSSVDTNIRIDIIFLYGEIRTDALIKLLIVKRTWPPSLTPIYLHSLL